MKLEDNCMTKDKIRQADMMQFTKSKDHLENVEKN